MFSIFRPVNLKKMEIRGRWPPRRMPGGGVWWDYAVGRFHRNLNMAVMFREPEYLFWPCNSPHVPGLFGQYPDLGEHSPPDVPLARLNDDRLHPLVDWRAQ